MNTVTIDDSVKMDKPGKATRFSCAVFNYLACYCRIGFCLLMLPFKIVIDKKGKLHFRHYKLHQLACLIMHISSLQFGMTAFWGMLNVTTFADQKHVPGVYMKVFYAMFNAGIVVFILNCWCHKSNPYEGLLKCAFQYADMDSQSFHSKYAGIGMGSMIALQMAATTYPEITGYWEIIEFKFTLSHALNIVTVLQSIYCQVMFQIMIILPFFISPFCMCLIGQRFRYLTDVAMESSGKFTKMDDLLQLMEHYLDVKSLVTSLNDAFGIILTFVFLSMVPTLGFGLSTMLSNTPISTMEAIRTVHILITSYICILLAASGSSHVQNFTKSAFEQMWKSGSFTRQNNDSSGLLAIMSYVESSCVAVGCTPFFLFTYKFIGTLTSALITYTIIMVQFRQEK